MSTLAERLREHANWSGPVSSNANACMMEAADTIDELRAALSAIMVRYHDPEIDCWFPVDLAEQAIDALREARLQKAGG